ncbi:Uncharacterised protein [Metamycoplasma arthritidis]|uniref:Hypothetical membrane protein n=1 Tax=Metamycoplasma arthritidis (strain 158L3-1) TaxID=243272 RepID=B3PMV0_META1|nr:hypothetical protein [Metamycoplasma arthritidis]ACF07352.1 hypothetical membrane protein [Metamycoplasma arthritidis 158L3-1]VEU78874.1 Uncharacterised protein [Metamycoplasma arthritidis]
MKKNYKIISVLLGSLLPITIIPSVLGIAISSKKNLVDKGLYFKNEYFTNYSNFENHIRNEIKETQQYDEKTIYYASNINKQFDSELSLNKFLYNNIKSHDVSLSKDNKLYANNSNLPLTNQQINELDFNNSNSNTRVYLGKDNVAYETEEEAKLSYFNSAQFYKFNNKFYKNKESIINELILEYNKIKSSSANDENKQLEELKKIYKLEDTSFMRFNAPNGVISNVDFTKNGALDQNLVKKFINSNVKRYIKWKDKIYGIEDFIQNHFNKLAWKDSSIIKVKSTKANKKYLVDVDKTEDANFYGDYILTSPSDDIKDFKNYSKWSKRKRNENIIDYHESIYKEIVNKFVSNLMMTVNNYLLDKKIEENKDGKAELLKKFHENFSIFNFLPLSEEAQNLINHLQTLRIDDSKHANLWEKFEDILKLMKNGKRGSFFNQLNIIYFSGLAYFAKYNASSVIVSLFKKYFRNLISKMNEYLSEALGDLYTDKDGKKINLLDAYNLGDYSLDLDVNNDFFISHLANNDNIINAISTINLASLNAMNTSSLLPFDDSGLLKKDSARHNYDKLEKLYDKYSLRSKKESNYIFDNNKGDYEVNKDIKGNHIASNALQYYNYQSAQSLNNYLRDEFLNSLANIDYSRYASNNRIMKNCEFGFDYYKKVTIEYHKEHNFASTVISQLENLSYKNQDDIKSLQDTIKNLKKDDLKKYINSKTMTGHKLELNKLVYEDQKTDVVDKINSAVQVAGGIIQTAGAISQLYFSIQASGINQPLNIVKSVQGLVGSVMGTLSSVPGLAIAAAAIDIVFTIITQLIGEKTQSDYVYSQTGNPKSQYIWDGGITTSRLWGFWQTEDATISKAKLLEPIQFMPEFSTDFYYYDGKRYQDHQTSVLEKDLICDVLTNNDQEFMKANNLEYLYSFESTAQGENNRYFTKMADLENELLANNAQKLKDWYKSSSGTINILDKSKNITNVKDLFEKLKEIISNDLRATLLVQLPKLNSENIPLDQISDQSKREKFSLEKLITLINNINKNHDLLESKDLLLFDGNLKDENKKSYLYDIKNLEKITKIFINKFNVTSKIVSKIMFSFNNKYDELNEAIKTKIYSILNNQKERIYFASYDDAFKHLMQLQYLAIDKKIIKENEMHKFIYQDKEFTTIEEAIEYCKKFIKSADEYVKTKGEENE